MRSVLFLSLAGLATLAACAPSAERGDGKRGSGPPLGFELASAQAGFAAPAGPVIDVSPAELIARLGAGNVRLIDVRTDEEVAAGMIPGAHHIALDEFDPAALNVAEDETVVFYCRSGSRSTKAAERLAAQAGEPERHLAGGILAWQEAGGAIVQPE
ncbi:rhodanese-like domain-containing protein [Erythrobacter sp. HL-111]|uniref:rhodanese-like domain-containing protein n=1 Tax=Erythrobacter sp. HL-111 TaxID=1798193 RepID=UPI0006DB9BE4|nr:rhodanese-like domain-containing protein [Erythrobacter sp. HL-111]KPP94314.1 MAG: Rhodanese-related sulfurtransferase [Erythrobacteraceae bacterium HL-111]SDS50100.1 Rhodanese-related sulfurtransferase [Erythrobacter sp. HL-111]